MKNKFYLTLLFIAFTFATRASHLAGGNIRYEFNGTNYTVYLELNKLCMGASLGHLPTMDLVFSSTSLSANFTRTFNATAFDTVKLGCYGDTTACNSATSSLPGYITAYYQDTVTLPPAGDWVMSYAGGAKVTLSNVLGIGNMYLETFLDNRVSVNSNPVVMTSNSVMIPVNTDVTVPLHWVDYDGDSVSLQLTDALEGSGMPVNYNSSSGCSALAPFGYGGTCVINNNARTLTIKSQTLGYFEIAYWVREYRNGQLISSHIRDFVIDVVAPTTLPLTGNRTYPVPLAVNGFKTVTCPGSSNSVSISFADPVSTDSVFIEAIPPVIPGWAFSTNVKPGLGNGTVNISWNTPVLLNPTLLPHFKIKLKVKDNECPQNVMDYFLAVNTQTCAADSVWPGDANRDGTVNLYDPLAIGIAYAQSGSSRSAANINWIPQVCQQWTGTFVADNVNMKHADCNGDGSVDITDLNAVNNNYSLKNHNQSPGVAIGQTVKTYLYFDTTGISFGAGQSVSVPVRLGTNALPLSGVYGIATALSADGLNLAAYPAMNSAVSWISNSSSTLSLTKPVNANTIDWAYCKMNHLGSAGSGVIGFFQFVVPAGLSQGVPFTLRFDKAKTRIIDSVGKVILISDIIDVPVVVGKPSGVQTYHTGKSSVALVPNPSSGDAQLIFDTPAEGRQVTVADALGRVVWYTRTTYQDERLYLPTMELAKGLYIVTVRDTQYVQVIKWIKN